MTPNRLPTLLLQLLELYIPLLLLYSLLLPQVLAVFFVFSHQHTNYATSIFPFFVFLRLSLARPESLFACPSSNITLSLLFLWDFSHAGCPWGCILFHSYHVTHKNRNVILVDKTSSLASDRSCFVLFSLQLIWAKQILGICMA